jgi:hypothetical protein
MAFPRAAGYTNLPQGNFTPEIFSQKVLMKFRRVSVVEDITNTDYSGEIEAFGDKVNIINEPDITVRTYARGATLQIEDLEDDETELTVDQGSYFAFKVDDIEERQSHVNWESLATGRGAFKLKDSFDSNILTAIQAGVQSANVYGSNASPTDTGFGAGEVDPANVVARLSRLLDDADVPEDSRWVVAPPIFWEELAQTGSKFMEVQVTGDSNSPMRDSLNNGRVNDRLIHGFRAYKSNNVPTPSGSNATQHVLAGHMSAVTTANNIAKTEMIRSQTSFADILRGLHVFGRKVLRADGIADAFIKID